jgi:tetratricopeptide (TPR) repeat protein
VHPQCPDALDLLAEILEPSEPADAAHCHERAGKLRQVLQEMPQRFSDEYSMLTAMLAARLATDALEDLHSGAPTTHRDVHVAALTSALERFDAVAPHLERGLDRNQGFREKLLGALTPVAMAAATLSGLLEEPTHLERSIELHRRVLSLDPPPAQREIAERQIDELGAALRALRPMDVPSPVENDPPAGEEPVRVYESQDDLRAEAADLLAAGRPGEALERYTWLTAGAGAGTTAADWSGLGGALTALIERQETGDDLHARAVDAFSQALEREPDLVAAWLGMGRVLGLAGKAREELACAVHALELAPGDAAAIEAVERARRRAGSVDAAKG